MQEKKIAVTLMTLLSLLSLAAFGASDEKEVKGMITSRSGETLIVKSGVGTTTVVLTDNTRTKDERGLFGREKQEMSSVVLIPGLKVDVDGVSDDQGRVIAKTITVDGDDLETSEMTQSGLHPPADPVAANGQSISANRQNIAANQQNISANQQNIAANKQQINENMKDIEENT